MPIDRSRNVDPRTAEIRLASAKRSPQTVLQTLFTKPPAHTFASGATQRFVSRPSLRLMVRTYIRKGGHGGDRSKETNSCRLLAEEGWPRRSSRSNGCSKGELLEEEAAKAAAANRWKQWAKHRDEQQSTSNQLQTV